MISYETGGVHFFLNLLRLRGSVFPKALVVSLPNAAVTSTFVWLLYGKDILGDHFKDTESVMNNNAIWGGFTFLVGFLVVFRTSQAYSRFWEGITTMHKMGAEWLDACSSMMAFCKHSQEPRHVIMRFQNTLIRLFSMLHAAALGEIEDAGEGNDDTQVNAFSMELIDAGAINDESLQAICDSDSRVELIFQWIQQFAVENIKTGVLSIPPPLLSRSFQEIATGMVHFHEAMKISNVPFPFPYAQTCDALLFMHWLISPFVVSQWVTKPWWAGVFSFIHVFTLWTLNLIAVELENPFGTDPNDIDGARMQLDMNNHLRLLIQPETFMTPWLKEPASSPDGCPAADATERMQLLAEQAVSYSPLKRKSASFRELWEDLGNNEATRRFSAMRCTTKVTVGTAAWPSIALDRGSRELETEIETKNFTGPVEPGRLGIPSRGSPGEALVSSPPSTAGDGSSPPPCVLGKWEPCTDVAISGSTLRSPRTELAGLHVKLGEIFNQIDSNGASFEGLWEDVDQDPSIRAGAAHPGATIHKIMQMRPIPSSQHTASAASDPPPPSHPPPPIRTDASASAASDAGRGSSRRQTPPGKQTSNYSS